MSLDLERLEKVRELANGIVQARCPACAEGGHDKAGEHLRIYPDGRFGCCVHPNDGEHRKRIFALAGDRQPRVFKVKVAAAPPRTEVGRSVRESLTGFLRTLRTPFSESATSGSELVASAVDSCGLLRTLRTGLSIPHAYEGEDRDNRCDDAYTYKDWKQPVLSVLTPKRPGIPFFTADGTLSIPFDSPERYHWWKLDGQRQSVKETTAELRARLEEVEHGATF